MSTHSRAIRIASERHICNISGEAGDFHSSLQSVDDRHLQHHQKMRKWRVNVDKPRHGIFLSWVFNGKPAITTD